MVKRRRLVHKPAVPPTFPVVGIGASAGGLEAFKALLKALPADTGMAFVLVQHMDPTHESLLNELLTKTTSMPVAQVVNRTRLEPNRVYVIPPNKDLSVVQGVLHLANLHSGHMPIDNFFCSLAKDQQENAIGVILSGTASDGTYGLKAIKSFGGITFAQDRKSSKFSGMPISAVASGYVDFVLTPQQIAHQLQRQSQEQAGAVSAAAPELPEESKALQTVLRLVKNTMDVDFSLYKPPTIKRRIRRRMILHHIPDLPTYAQYLKTHASEIRDLFEDILIPVTAFFREPKTFRALQADVFPKIAAHARKTKSIRIWVPGCSTGEEVYSIAMALLEYLGDQAAPLKIQLFGTDLSERGVQVARNGLYTSAALKNVSEDRLSRFFVKAEGGHQIAKSIREICIFARHDLAKDPPFSKLDLISCQNVFIYLSAVLQKRIMAGFHYALRPSGYLVLGKSEAPIFYSDFFALEDRKNKIFSRKPGVVRHLPQITRSIENTHPAPPVSAKGSAENLIEEARHILLEGYSVPAFVVDNNLHIVHFQGDTSPFIKPSTGAASLQLAKMLRPEFVVDLRSLVHRARKEGTPAHKDAIEFEYGGKAMSVAMEAVPFHATDSAGSHFMVLFPRLEPLPQESLKEPLEEGGRGSRREVALLRRELSAMQKSLKSITEDQEAANQELKTANEEILSSNEELSSTNEELETAKEELQSANEELITLNEELQNRNVELSNFGDDLSSLLTGVNIPVLILDNDRRIRRFTAAAQRLFNLIPTDVGRSFGDISSNLETPHWNEWISLVTDQLQTIERSVTGRDGRWYSLRMRPYKAAENKIDGVLIALLDVDQIKRQLDRTEESLDTTHKLYRLVTENTTDLVALHSADGKYLYASPSRERLLGFNQQQILGKLPTHFCHTGDRKAVAHAFREAARSLNSQQITYRAITRDGCELWLETLITPIVDAKGKVTRLQSSSRDTTERKQAESELIETHKELRALMGRLISVQEEESKRISRELHDAFSQELAALATESSLLKRDLPPQAKTAAKKVDSIARRIGHLAKGIQQLSRLLHPAVLDDFGLSVALKGECDAFQRRQGMRTNFVSANVPKSIPENVALCLYRVAQESLHNIGKHSGAEKVHVRLSSYKNEIHLKIQDFGDGFDLQKQKGKKGLGLTSMEERVHYVGGRFTIDSKPGKGTDVQVRIPLK